jgi:hypothetical protein
MMAASRSARTTQRLLASLVSLAIAAQFFLAGAAAFHAGLGVLGSDTQAWFGALHGINALAVMGAAGSLARRAWQPLDTALTV